MPDVERDVRVIQLANYASSYPGSFVPMLLAAVRVVQERGWEMEVLLPEAAAQRAWLSQLTTVVPVDFVPRRSALATTAWLRRRLRADQTRAIVHTHFLAFDLPAMAAALGQPHVDVVWHKHGSLRSDPSAVLRAVAKYGVLGRSVDAVITVAPSVVGEMRRRGVRRRRLHTLVNGIDIDRFAHRDPAVRQRVRDELGVLSTESMLLHFGWWWDVKGGDLFLGALARLRARGEPVVGVTVGGGDAARALASELGVASALRVIEPVSDARELYASADLFAATSRSEGMPFAVLEAVASGLPIVASAIPPHRELARHLENVVLAEMDSDDIADAVVELLRRDEAAAAESMDQSRRWLAEHLTLDAWAHRLAGVYEQLLDEDDGRRR
jgi:glycosyltransferase involved in cell wall biosynthesis